MSIATIISEMLQEVREADADERQQLGDKYDHNSYSSGYNMGYIEALKELRRKIEDTRHD